MHSESFLQKPIRDLIQVDPLLLAKWDRPVPRYTSYPTAPHFYGLTENSMREKLCAFDRTTKPLSLYFHIPFCKTMCLFCGCSVILNRKPERQSLYLRHLLREIELVALHFSTKRLVSQMHLGGGTPTSLTEGELEQLMAKVEKHFTLVPDAEISIEIDPRTVYLDQGRKLALLKRLGFTRVSFGVQDLDPLVQEAVRRRQSEEMTVTTYLKARELGFQGINIDLIYGLPYQTVNRFIPTAEKLIDLKPDRIAFYSYAKIPWLKKHQKAIPEHTLPTTEEKFRIYIEARARFMQAGYTAIGMDHFASPSDSLAAAYKTKRLTRNFQGYAVQMAEDMLGFGMTAIGFLENTYFQNSKELASYQDIITRNQLPIYRGYCLNEEDILRRNAIQSLMCHFELDKKQFNQLANTASLQAEGLLEETADKCIATPLGRLFIRIIASSLDTYLHKGQYARGV